MTALEELLQRPGGGRLGLIVRHGPRQPIDSARAVLEARLTPEGLAAATAFGGRLAGLGPLVAWHSPIPRCGETAEALLAGAAEAGAEGRLAGPLPAIGGPYMTDPIGAMREFVRDRNGFVRRWFDGGYPRELILSRAEASRLQLAGLVAAWGTAPEAGLAVFVTHDLNLLATREELLGLRHEEAGWIECLDGLWAELTDTELVVGIAGRQGRVPIGTLVPGS
jgi:broad specificity phosphatase PhoE